MERPKIFFDTQVGMWVCEGRGHTSFSVSYKMVFRHWAMVEQGVRPCRSYQLF